MPMEKNTEQTKRSHEGQPVPVAPDDLNPALTLGMRVRLDGAPINTTLATSLGTVVAEDQWDTFVVRLDSPAIYHNDDGTEQRLDEIRVLSFNVTPIS